MSHVTIEQSLTTKETQGIATYLTRPPMLENLLIAVHLATKNPILEQPTTHTTLQEKTPRDVKNLTVKAKIKRNYYKCDTLTEWIRKDNARCLPKPRASTSAQSTTNASSTTKPVRGPVRSSQGNTYEYHSCTWYAKSRRPDLPNNLGNAYSWVASAAAQGIPTGSVPRAGAIGQQGGHVVYVERVNNDGTIYLSERNFDWNGSFRYRTAPASNFIYIY